MKLYSIIILAAVCGLYMFGPIAQDPAYHDFADQRTVMAIPNILDTISNIPFLIVGLLGLLAIRKATDAPLRPLYTTFFAGITLTSFGSAYYHLAPCDATLVWDRLPMTVAFMSIFAVIISEQIHKKAGYILIIPLLLFGVRSVYYWHLTGDLRPYILVQFLPIVLMPMMLFMHPARAGLRNNMMMLIGGYGISKILEQLDLQLYDITNHAISGHSLKHVVAALSIIFVIRQIRVKPSVIHEDPTTRSHQKIEVE